MCCNTHTNTQNNNRRPEKGEEEGEAVASQLLGGEKSMRARVLLYQYVHNNSFFYRSVDDVFNALRSVRNLYMNFANQ